MKVKTKKSLNIKGWHLFILIFSFPVESLCLFISPPLPKCLTDSICSVLLCLRRKKMEISKWKGSVEAKITAPLEVAWKIVTDYYEEHKWFPGVKSSERVEGAPNKGVGAVRRVITSMPSVPNDFFLVEELTAQDDAKHSCTILTTDTDLPGYAGYEATFEFFETGELGSCLFKWSYQMSPVEGRSKEETEGLMNYVLTGIVTNLQQLAASQ